MGIFHELSVHVQDELLDRGVHLQRLELQLDARRASAAAEEDVADDLGTLELCERRRLTHGRIFETPGLLTDIDVLRQVLLEEALEQTALREEPREIFRRDRKSVV